VVEVEPKGGLILGVHGHGEGGDLETGGEPQGVGQQGTAQSLAAKGLIHRQASHPDRWDRGVTGKFPSGLGRKLGQHQAGRGKGLIASDPARGGDGHKAGGDAAADVLGDAVPEVVVEGL
jgi:hypothetical protein